MAAETISNNNRSRLPLHPGWAADSLPSRASRQREACLRNSTLTWTM